MNKSYIVVEHCAKEATMPESHSGALRRGGFGQSGGKACNSWLHSYVCECATHCLSNWLMDGRQNRKGPFHTDRTGELRRNSMLDVMYGPCTVNRHPLDDWASKEERWFWDQYIREQGVHIIHTNVLMSHGRVCMDVYVYMHSSCIGAHAYVCKHIHRGSS